MNTQENNKLIAEFMGMKYSDKRVFIDGNWIHSVSSLTRFCTDWNWLMEVVDKIESIVWEEINDTSFNVTIGATSYCVIQDNNGGMIEIIGEGKSKLDSVYNACVKFVKWYNEQNK